MPTYPRKHRFSELFIYVLLALAGSHITTLAQRENWVWYKSGDDKPQTRKELDDILQNHREWVEQGNEGKKQTDALRANLFRAELSNADFTNAELSGAVLAKTKLDSATLKNARLFQTQLWDADLTNAHLETNLPDRTDLKEANLLDATLVGANLTNARLCGTIFDGAKLTNAKLIGVQCEQWVRVVSFKNSILRAAELRDANLNSADFTGTDLTEAILNGADLTNCILKGANMYLTDLEGILYNPKEDPLPADIAYARNLDRMVFKENRVPLIRLKKSLRDGAFHNAERKVNTSLRRHDASRVESILFDCTCGFGSNPKRPLLLILYMLIISTIIYRVFLHRGGKSSLHLVVSRKRQRSIRLSHRCALPSPRLTTKHFLRSECRAWRAALGFGLMSTFRLGYGELNFGQWVNMLQTREYEIKPTRWLRTISAIQSILSIYFVALWLLSTFGRPFDVG